MTYEIDPEDIPEKNLDELLKCAEQAIIKDGQTVILIASLGKSNEKYLLSVQLNDSNELVESFFVSNDAIIFEGYLGR